MFKDIYKSANDDIVPNAELLKSILSKAEEKRPPVYIGRYALAACAAVIALTIALSGNLYTPKTRLLDATPPLSTESNIIQNQGAETETKKQSEEIFSYNKTIDYASDIATYTTGSATEDALSTSEPAVVMAINTVPFSENVATMRASTESNPAEISCEELSAADYFDYLGFSPDTLDLPENLIADFTSETVITLSKKDGEVLSDTATFTYSGDAFVSVTTSSDTAEVLPCLENDEYEKSKFGDLNAVILYDGSVYQAYTLHSSGTALKITAVDLTEEQIKNIMISIAE